MKDILLYCVFIVGILMVLYPITMKMGVHLYRKRKYTEILNEIVSLFEGIDPYQISKEARGKIPDPPPDLMYGEVGLFALLDLLDMIKPKPHAHFYDLGSGCGKPAFAVKLRYPTIRVTAVEVLEPLHLVGEKKLHEYRNRKNLTEKDFMIHFICDDIIRHNFSNGDIIFINATAISQNNWQQILYKLVQLKPGTIVIITSKQLPAPTFVKKYQGMEIMSWGLTSTYIYEKGN